MKTRTVRFYVDLHSEWHLQQTPWLCAYTQPNGEKGPDQLRVLIEVPLPEFTKILPHDAEAITVSTQLVSDPPSSTP